MAPLPQHKRLGVPRNPGPFAGSGSHDVTGGRGGEHARLMADAEEVFNPGAQLLIFFYEREDPSNPGEVDSLFFGEPLDLFEFVDVPQ